MFLVAVSRSFVWPTIIIRLIPTQETCIPRGEPKRVQDDEEESVDWGDVAEDSSDREPAGGLQSLLAGTPENLMDND